MNEVTNTENNSNNNQTDYSFIAKNLITEILHELNINLSAKDPIVVQYLVNQKLLAQNMNAQDILLTKITQIIKDNLSAEQNHQSNEQLLKAIQEKLNKLIPKLQNTELEEQNKQFTLINQLFEKITITNAQTKNILQENTLQIKQALLSANDLSDLENTPIVKKLNTISLNLGKTYKGILYAGIGNVCVMVVFWCWIFIF